MPLTTHPVLNDPAILGYGDNGLFIPSQQQPVSSPVVPASTETVRSAPSPKGTTAFYARQAAFADRKGETETEATTGNSWERDYEAEMRSLEKRREQLQAQIDKQKLQDQADAKKSVPSRETTENAAVRKSAAGNSPAPAEQTVPASPALKLLQQQLARLEDDLVITQTELKHCRTEIEKNEKLKKAAQEGAARGRAAREENINRLEGRTDLLKSTLDLKNREYREMRGKKDAEIGVLQSRLEENDMELRRLALKVSLMEARDVKAIEQIASVDSRVMDAHVREGKAIAQTKAATAAAAQAQQDMKGLLATKQDLEDALGQAVKERDNFKKLVNKKSSSLDAVTAERNQLSGRLRGVTVLNDLSYEKVAPGLTSEIQNLRAEDGRKLAYIRTMEEKVRNLESLARQKGIIPRTENDSDAEDMERILALAESRQQELDQKNQQIDDMSFHIDMQVRDGDQIVTERTKAAKALEVVISDANLSKKQTKNAIKAVIEQLGTYHIPSEPLKAQRAEEKKAQAEAAALLAASEEDDGNDSDDSGTSSHTLRGDEKAV